MAARPATLGFSAHTGWATLLALSGAPAAPEVVDRRRIELIDGDDSDSARFVYHRASELELSAARGQVTRTIKVIDRATQIALRAALADLAARDIRPATAAIIGKSAGETLSLADILKSHSAIHTAEGRLYRATIATACHGQKLTVLEAASSTLLDAVSKASGLPSKKVELYVDAIKKQIGAPWGQDQKQAMLAAWWALASKPAAVRRK